VLAGLVGSVLGTYVASLPNGGQSLNYEIADLAGQQLDMFKAALSQTSKLKETVMADWGLMNAIATMKYQGVWAWPDTSQAQTASLTQYELMLWRALLPAAWIIDYTNLGAPPPPYGFPESHNLHLNGNWYWPELRTAGTPCANQLTHQLRRGTTCSTLHHATTRPTLHRAG
jgi:hypothetical protein